MAKIHLTTLINAPAERVFDLSRSVNLHRIAFSNTYEKAIGGVTTGLINENETVIWQAKHLYKVRKFTTKITSMEFPHHFTVQMVHGDFKSFRHEHYFKPINNGTFLIDVIEFESPYGVIGQLAEKLFLTSYLHKLLLHRNEVIKQYAETSKWKAILN
jgi:ligand-binding SRPBCC domain-containing protein